jgi:carbamoyl-phosphate synthase large subunit
VQQACAGEEFSIDVFCDLEGRCLNAIPRTMIESKGGESIKGMTIKDWGLIEHGRFVAETLGLRGPANIQCFREGDELQVTDINPRFGGAFPLPRAAGSGYPELAIALANGERPEPRLGEFREGILMTRFFSHLILAPGPDGTLEPFDEELPEPLVTDPGEA